MLGDGLKAKERKKREEELAKLNPGLVPKKPCGGCPKLKKGSKK